MTLSSQASFEVQVSQEDITAFAKISGDWNPLHTDAEYARRSAYARPVMHGAFSAALLSRLAGMHLPGLECVLHSMHLRFIAPIRPPAKLLVSGQVVSRGPSDGKVDATVSDAETGVRYVSGSY